MTVRLNLLFGFLGSGKTTLARRLLDRPKLTEKTAIIVNEFGDVGIDGAILEGGNVDMIELTSGCLCCTLKGSLLNAVEELAGRAGARRIIVEATGVAQPEELLETFADPSLKGRYDIGPVVTVVDSPKYARLVDILGEFYRAQVENADLIVLNKTDLASANTLESARAAVAQINPRADIYFAERCDVDLDALLNGPSSQAARAYGADRFMDHDHEHHDHDHRHAPAESFVLDAEGNAARSAIEAFFCGLPDNVWRAKGFMDVGGRFSLIQYAMGNLEIQEAGARPMRNMVFIGRSMNKEEIADRFRAVRETPKSGAPRAQSA
jgi:G3E family GTPase